MENNNQLMGESLVNLIICYQQLANRINQTIEPLGLNMTQLSILNHFSWQPQHSATIGELATTMEMKQPAVTKAVKSMSEKGWMSKKQDNDDARISLVSITDIGLDKLMQARKASAPLLHETFGKLEVENLAQLNNLLITLKKSFN